MPDLILKRLSYGCYIFSSLLGMVIIAAAAGANSALTFPGRFFFERFHLAALYIPGLFLLCGLLLRSGRLPRRTMLLLWVSPVVFFTSAIMFQVITGNSGILASRILVDTFGRVAASLLFVLLFVLELGGMVKITMMFSAPGDGLITWKQMKKYLQVLTGFLGMRSGGEDGVPAGDDEPTLEDLPPMAFPSFPDIPEPPRDENLEKQAAPDKPAFPGSPGSDPAISELIRRTLTGNTAKKVFEKAEMPDHSAFPQQDDSGDWSLPSNGSPRGGQDREPDFGYVFKGGNSDFSRLSGFESAATGEIPEEETDDALGHLEDDEEPVLVSGYHEMSSGRYSELLVPEEDRDNIDISVKLDPADTPPQGVLTERPPRPKRRRKYEVPVAGVLADYPESDFSAIDENTRRAGEVLEQTLKEFKIEAKVTGIRKGPVITMYELLPSPGVKISSIVNLQDNIALRLAASRVRIIAPIPGKHAVGIEVPNKKRAIVSFSSLVDSEEFREADAAIPVILGKDIAGGNQVIDLTRTPHLLIAGATGSGKSVCVNSLIGSILYSRTPQQVKMIMVDPKIVELKLYNDIPHLLTPVITEPKRALQALQWCLYEMERRYSLLDTLGVRDIRTFNKRVSDRRLATEPLPYIVVLVDEFADLMATSGKELEAIVARLAAMSRAVGIHLVLATQRPSVDVITGLIKANFPSRIAFMVAGKTDSRIIIDAVGAEKLLGRGDMLFTSAWDPFPARMQGAFLAEEEVERMSDHVKTLGEPDYIDDEMFIDEEDEEDFHLESVSGDDPMYEKGLEIVISTRKASASYLQRRLKIGYNRAARLVEEMERRGIVGPANGSKPRDLIHIPERFLSSGGAVEREPSTA